MAGELAVPELSYILVAVGKRGGALAGELTVPELPDILAVGKVDSALAVRPTRIDHVGITGWKGALPIGWQAQANE